LTRACIFVVNLQVLSDLTTTSYKLPKKYNDYQVICVRSMWISLARDLPGKI